MKQHETMKNHEKLHLFRRSHHTWTHGLTQKKFPPCSTVLRYNMTWDDGRKHIVNKSSHFGSIKSRCFFGGRCDFQARCLIENYFIPIPLSGIYALKIIEYTYILIFTTLYSWTPRNQPGFSWGATGGF